MPNDTDYLSPTYRSPPPRDRRPYHDHRYRDRSSSRAISPLGFVNASANTSDANGSSVEPRVRVHRRRERRLGRRLREKQGWKKLLWVSQQYPDNYTDPSTFLDHLQRNPRLQPYEFWRLVADSTVVVQQVCSVAIFVCCFAVIFQERVSPVAIVSFASAATVLGWIIWDTWLEREMQRERDNMALAQKGREAVDTRLTADGSSSASVDGDSPAAVSGMLPATLQQQSSHSSSFPTGPNTPSASRSSSPPPTLSPSTALAPTPSHPFPSSSPSGYTLSLRMRQRLSTVKSTLLIYSAVLGLSPILKSLTRSTTSDSIWALSSWLMIINVLFFDYSSGPQRTSSPKPIALSSHAGTTNPVDHPGSLISQSHMTPSTTSSLATNAAVMASTVLASRLRSTIDVFSLTLFSIMVFGLFPVFRRLLRRTSWRLHCLLTLALVLGAGAGIAVTLRGGPPGSVVGGKTLGAARGSGVPAAGGGLWATVIAWDWRGAMYGALGACVVNALLMGGCSWWLIGLQKYKNEIVGPWDVAAPKLRRRWD